MSVPVYLEQLKRIPESSPDLPSDAVYVKLGCLTCPHSVNFAAWMITSTVPEYSRNPDAARDLFDIIVEVEKGTTVKGNSSSTWDRACSEQCPQLEDMQTAVDLLNDRFGAELTIDT
jgi:hypothetical protein